MRTWTWLSIALAGGLLGLAGPAAAQECTDDGDCLKSYRCEVVGESGCGFACPDGMEPCEPPPDFMCEPMQYKACVPGPCTTDADCEAGMVCFEQEVYDCPPVAEFDCPPGADCPMPAEPEPCTPTKQSSCVPKYVPPCMQDADCGDGFDCVEDVIGSCTGGGAAPTPAPTPDPGTAGAPAPEPLPPPPDEPVCTEMPAGTFHCEPREQVCADDSECPSGWSCAENPSRPVCSGPSEPVTPPAPSADCPDAIPELCRSCADGSCGKPVCVDSSWTFVCPEDAADMPAPSEPAPMPAPDDCGIDPSTTPEKVCVPPFSDLGWGFGFAEDGVAASGVPGSDAPTAAPAPSRDAMEPGSADPSSGENASLGSGETASETMVSDDGGLCAVSAPGVGGGGKLAGVLAGLGVGLLLARRRRLA